MRQPTRSSESGHGVGDPRRVLEALLGVPFTEGNSVEVLCNGEEIFPAWIKEIQQATRSIDLMSFLWGRGPITAEVTKALAERAQAGVRVRVLLDAMGSKGTPPSQVAQLRAAGAQVRFFRPTPTWRLTVINARTHRRALVCDGQVAFTGGTGIDRAWSGHGRNRGDWRDTAVCVRGPAVDGIRGAFAASWVQTPHDLIDEFDRFPTLPPAGTAAVQSLRPASQPGWNDAVVAYLALLYTARDRVRIATPYLRLPSRLLAAVTATARRGVQVQLLVPGPHVDHPLVRLQGQHDHAALLRAGVELWGYQPSMLHAKVTTVDGRLSMVGSTNFDARSLVLNEQIALLIDDPVTTSTLDASFDADLTLSHRITPEEWAQRGRRQRFLESLAHAAGYPVRGMGAAGMTGLSHSAVPHRRRRRRAGSGVAASGEPGSVL